MDLLFLIKYLIVFKWSSVSRGPIKRVIIAEPRQRTSRMYARAWLELGEQIQKRKIRIDRNVHILVFRSTLYLGIFSEEGLTTSSTTTHTASRDLITVEVVEGSPRVIDIMALSPLLSKTKVNAFLYDILEYSLLFP